MTELAEWFGEARKTQKLHSLLLIAVFIVVFLEIHPFQDGNGRLSRVPTTLLLLQAGYAYVPYSSLESVIRTARRATTLRSVRPSDDPGNGTQLATMAALLPAVARSTEAQAGRQG